VNTLPTNVIPFPSKSAAEAIEAELEIELDAQDPTPTDELQLWSALTLGALQKQLTGHEDDQRFSAARALVDNLAKQFASADPIDIANYFLAIEAIASIQGHSLDRLDELEAIDPIAA